MKTNVYILFRTTKMDESEPEGQSSRLLMRKIGDVYRTACCRLRVGEIDSECFVLYA